MKKQKTNQKPGIVLFDFDGTLSAGDANVGFWKYCFRNSLRPWLFLPVIFFGILLQIMAWIIRICFVRHISHLSCLDIFWREMLRPYLTPVMIKKLAAGFIKEFKQNRFGWAAEQVAKERAAGNFVILASASPEYLLMPLVKDMKFDLIICSEIDPVRPWKFKFFNYGENKVRSLNTIMGNRPNIIRAYSDSKSDLPMMRLAKEQVWIHPQTGCRKN
ncbi:MAG: haloacid dehalogenase-like hydrolase [Alphaproteobacteria bacterium]|nr:haloacid dehalogenase-like hydrolase [Alphaproteobacteria bacterium]